MEKDKMYLIGGGVAVAGIIAYMLYTSKNTGNATNVSTCPSGQVPCSNNRLKCYNPLTTYATDPCATAVSTTDPISQIVSGIIGLFKKKPATTSTTTATPYPAIS